MKHKRILAAAFVLALGSPAAAQSVEAGIQAWQHSNYDAAVRIWRPLALKGDADAQFNLAQAYRLGRGVPTNLAIAQTWLQRAATQGHVDAQTTLGLLLFQGGNRPAGIRWLKTAADKNDPRAMLVYGTALFNGDSVKADPVLGYSFVRKAAAQGLGAAKETLAQMDQTMSADDRAKAVKLADAKPAPKAAEPKRATKVKVATANKPEVKSDKPAPALVKSPPAAVAQDKPAKAEPAIATGNWRVQLGAFSQRSSAEGLFRKLSGTSALQGRSPIYTSAGAVTRLQVGPFASKAAAAEACRALSARGQACFPVPAR